MAIPSKNPFKSQTRSNVLSVSGANYTFTDTDGVSSLYITPTSGDLTVTLPSVSLSAGRNIFIKKPGASFQVVIDTPGSETIDGAAQNALQAQNAFVELECDGANWFVRRADDYMISEDGSFVNDAASGHYYTGRNLVVPAGQWELSGRGVYFRNGATVNGLVGFFISTNANNDGSDIYSATFGFNNGSPVTDLSLGIPPKRIILTATTTTYYCKGYNGASSGTPQHSVAIIARRFA